MPVFHTFTAGGKRYMFDANTNVIINLKEDLYFELEKYMQSGYKEITPAIEKLRDRGYLKDRADFEMVHPMDSTLEYSLERCIGTIALQVTQGCNLRCKYCAYSGSYDICLDKQIDDTVIEAACKDSGLEDFIKEVSLDHVVGQNGAMLSGGQKQKIALARALVHDKPIIIFDEATSNTDAYSEQQINGLLDTRLKDKTVIVITHKCFRDYFPFGIYYVSSVLMCKL